MKKHFVRTLGAAVLMIGSLVVVAAQPASAVRYFVHGNVTCDISTGFVQYSPTLHQTAARTTRFRVKGALTNCTDGHNDGIPGGETGVGTSRVMSGTFTAISDWFSGTCDTITPPSITMLIRWNTNDGTKVRPTNLGFAWNPDTDVAQSGNLPYAYQFVGGSVQTQGVVGSYLGSTTSMSLFGNIVSSQACVPAFPGRDGRLHNGWAIDPTAGSQLVLESPPAVSGLNPNQGLLGQQGLDVDVSGQDFAPGDTLGFSGTGITVNSTNYVSPNEMTANISIDPGALAGARDVTVTNSTNATITCPSCFMVAPIVSGASPSTGGQGANGLNITITGQGFANGAIAQIEPTGSTGATSDVTTNFTQFVDGNTLIANVDISPNASLTDYDITVIDPGQGVGVCSVCFSVNTGPAVTNTSPNTRGAGATNQVVAINGTGFTPTSTVTFGGGDVSVTNTSYVSPTQLLATINIAPGSPSGLRSITVDNPDGGEGSCANCFSVTKGPVVTLWQVIANGKHSINPNPDPQGRRDRDVYTVDIAITGTGFQPGAVVSYPAAGVTTLIVNSQTYVSTTKIKQNITIDYGDFSQLQTNPPDRTVIVTNPDGGTYSLPGAVILVG
jgi:hypothetical protein